MNLLRALSASFVSLFFMSAGVHAQQSLDALLKPLVQKYDLPAIAAAVVKNGRIVASGVAGSRRVGLDIPALIDDRFHLGSCTKAITGMLGGILVDEGKLRWSSTVAEIFPELAPKMHAAVGKITLEQLLNHTSGLVSDNEEANYPRVAQALKGTLDIDGNLDEVRYWFIQQWLSDPLEAAPGARYKYSNLGYVLAGAMMERVTRKTWEELIVEKIYAPLDLKSAGIGPHSTVGRVDAPLPHELRNGKPFAYLSGPNSDLPLVYGPAGLSHMSVLDFARWGSFHAGEGRRGPPLVSPETLKKIHTSFVSMPELKGGPSGMSSAARYSLGWAEVSATWAGGAVLHHAGSNAKNFSHIWVDPKRDLAIVIVTNIGNAKQADAFFAVLPELFARYGQ
jgi:CubicO group peptidase (beta-lactamase class C family)